MRAPKIRSTEDRRSTVAPNEHTESVIAVRDAGIALWYAVIFAGAAPPFDGGPEDWWVLDKDREVMLRLLRTLPHEATVSKCHRAYQRALDRCIALNMGSVHSLVNKWHQAGSRAGLDKEDLTQFGVLGLMKAVQRFDPTRGFTFYTYAFAWIFQNVTRAIFTNNIVHTPVPRKSQENSKLKERAKQAKNVGSIDDPAMTAFGGKGNHENRGWHEINADTSILSPEQVLCMHQDIRNLAAAMAELTPREVSVLRMRFEEELPLSEIGEKLISAAKSQGLTRERIRQIEQQALGKLRDILDRDNVNMLDVGQD